MPRKTTPALDNRLAAQVTATGYLLRIEPPTGSPLQLCDLGDLHNAELGDFASGDFGVQNAGADEISLTLGNIDGAAGALVLAADPLASLRVSLWQVERGAPDDAVALGVYLPIFADVGLEVVRMTLHGKFMRFRFAPSRRINAANGFKYALRPGEVFLWGAQRVIIRKQG